MDSFTLSKIEFHEIRRILAEYCACSLGKELARRISPSRTPQVIQKWLAQVSQMERAIRERGILPFGGVTDVTAALERARPGGGAGCEDFAAIAATLEGAANVRKYVDALGEGFELLAEMASPIGDFSGEIAAVWSILDRDATVRDGASQRLTEIRRRIEMTSQHIHDVIYGYLRDPEVAKLLQNVTVTLHGDRFVLPVRQENRGRLPGVVHRESNSGATAFVEPNACVELNNLLSDLRQDERDEVQRLLNQLAIRISARAEDIASALRALAHLDVVSAKAQYAYQFEMTCPEVTERGPIQFPQARHPLLIEQARRQELAGIPPEKRHPVVPIDVRLGQDFDLLVVTGSNTGGKTVSLKTVATLVLMAQTGMHIPVARGATMPAFHDVFLDVGDEQSLQQSLSTFGAHMKRIRYVLGKATSACLVLLDELGSGTDPDEGGAIGQAVLDEFRRVGCLGMVTTHLSVLKAYAYANERVDNASVEFDTATLSPTYRLLIGTPGESHAITVAQKLGLPKRIISAARAHHGQQGRQFRRAIRATNAVRQSAETARAEAREAQMQALSQQEVYQAKLADLHRLQQEFETWLARLGELKAGDELYVPSLKRTGRLVRLELHRQIALVDSESLQVEVPISELMPDFGQQAVREQIAALRKQVIEQATTAEKTREEAVRIREEYHRSLAQQRQRAEQFDRWLGAIARVKVGDEVPIARRPGRATVVRVDLPALRATVKTGDGEFDLSIQDLFPQTGPFAQLAAERAERMTERRAQAAAQRRAEPAGAPAEGAPAHGRPPRLARAAQQGQPPRVRREGPPPRYGEHAPAGAQRTGADRREYGQHTPRPPDPDRPMDRGRAEGQSAEADRQRLLALKPGDPVFVVPFHKRATLIRMNAERGQAVVQSGIFEMEIPLSDLQPLHEPPPAAPPKPARKPAPPKAKPDEPQAQKPPAETPPVEGTPAAQANPDDHGAADSAPGESAPPHAPADTPPDAERHGDLGESQNATPE